MVACRYCCLELFLSCGGPRAGDRYGEEGGQDATKDAEATTHRFLSTSNTATRLELPRRRQRRGEFDSATKADHIRRMPHPLQYGYGGSAASDAEADGRAEYRRTLEMMKVMSHILPDDMSLGLGAGLLDRVPNCLYSYVPNEELKVNLLTENLPGVMKKPALIDKAIKKEEVNHLSLVFDRPVSRQISASSNWEFSKKKKGEER